MVIDQMDTTSEATPTGPATRGRTANLRFKKGPVRGESVPPVVSPHYLRSGPCCTVSCLAQETPTATPRRVDISKVREDLGQGSRKRARRASDAFGDSNIALEGNCFFFSFFHVQS